MEGGLITIIPYKPLSIALLAIKALTSLLAVQLLILWAKDIRNVLNSTLKQYWKQWSKSKQQLV